MGIILLLPFFLVRFGLLSRLNREAVRRAAYFAPLKGGEKSAYWVYQLSNGAVLVCLCFAKIKFAPGWLFFTGVGVYLAGLLLLIASVINFAAPARNGFNRNGLYRFSRNPMYLAYFVYFIGCALVTQSPLLLGFVLIFQTAAHWIIRSEERWCVQRFGREYLEYMQNVRRYL